MHILQGRGPQVLYHLSRFLLDNSQALNKPKKFFLSSSVPVYKRLFSSYSCSVGGAELDVQDLEDEDEEAAEDREAKAR